MPPKHTTTSALTNGTLAQPSRDDSIMSVAKVLHRHILEWLQLQQSTAAAAAAAATRSNRSASATQISATPLPPSQGGTAVNGNTPRTATQPAPAPVASTAAPAAPATTAGRVTFGLTADANTTAGTFALVANTTAVANESDAVTQPLLAPASAVAAATTAASDAVPPPSARLDEKHTNTTATGGGDIEQSSTAGGAAGGGGASASGAASSVAGTTGSGNGSAVIPFRPLKPVTQIKPMHRYGRHHTNVDLDNSDSASNNEWDTDSQQSTEIYEPWNFTASPATLMAARTNASSGSGGRIPTEWERERERNALFDIDHFLRKEYTVGLPATLNMATRVAPFTCFTQTQKVFKIDAPNVNHIYRFIKRIFDKERLMETLDIPLSARNWIPVVMTALLTASKVWDDLSSFNAEFSSIIPLFSTSQMNELERRFVSHLNYNLYISASDYALYYFALRALQKTPSTAISKYYLNVNVQQQQQQMQQQQQQQHQQSQAQANSGGAASGIGAAGIGFGGGHYANGAIPIPGGGGSGGGGGGGGGHDNGAFVQPSNSLATDKVIFPIPPPQLQRKVEPPRAIVNKKAGAAPTYTGPVAQSLPHF